MRRICTCWSSFSSSCDCWLELALYFFSSGSYSEGAPWIFSGYFDFQQPNGWQGHWDRTLFKCGCLRQLLVWWRPALMTLWKQSMWFWRKTETMLAQVFPPPPCLDMAAKCSACRTLGQRSVSSHWTLCRKADAATIAQQKFSWLVPGDICEGIPRPCNSLAGAGVSSCRVEAFQVNSQVLTSQIGWQATTSWWTYCKWSNRKFGAWSWRRRNYKVLFWAPVWRILFAFMFLLTAETVH